MDNFSTEILLGIVVLLLFLYYHLTNGYDFWKKRNVQGPKPIPFFGNYKDVFLGKIHAADYVKKLYETYSEEPAIGIFFRKTPVLIVEDLEMLNEVFIKSFSNFVDRGIKIYTDLDPLSQHITYLEPERWRIWRKKISPVFTSGKLKESFYLVNECAHRLAQHLENLGKFYSNLFHSKLFFPLRV